MDNTLKDITALFERIIEKAKKLEANKKYTKDERGAIIKGLREEFTDALLKLEYIIDTPGYRDPAYEIQESFVLKARDLGIIKSDEELDELFMEIYKRKKAAKLEGSNLKAIKKSIDKYIAERDLSKLAHIWHDTLTAVPDKLSADTEEYLFEELLKAGFEDEVEELRIEIEERAKEKRFREEERELKNHESRLRKLEREHEKEEEAKFKKEYRDVSRRSGSYWKTVDTMFPDDMFPKPARLPVELESPGFCIKCKKIIKNEMYYYEPKSRVLMHSSCAKEEFDKESYKGKPELEIAELIKELYE